MYEFIKGRLTEKTPTYAVIEANGIGYLLHISLHTYSQLKEDEHCTLLVHLVVREDALILFGFSGDDERPGHCPGKRVPAAKHQRDRGENRTTPHCRAERQAFEGPDTL